MSILNKSLGALSFIYQAASNLLKDDAVIKILQTEMKLKAPVAAAAAANSTNAFNHQIWRNMSFYETLVR